MNQFCPQELVVEKRKESPGNYPDPVVAAIFALAGISLGQFYNGRPLRGLLWVTGGIALVLLVRENILLLAPAVVFFLVACAIDAYSTAQEIGNRTITLFKISRLFWIEIMLALASGTALSITIILKILYSSGVGR